MRLPRLLQLSRNVLVIGATLLGTTPSGAQPAPAAESLVDSVTRMARVGMAGYPSFSPDGKTVAFISDLNGVPQVWTVPSTGGYPRMVTAGNDPVQSVEWSPTDPNMLASAIAPGGGMNVQVYVVRADGTGLRRLTPGGKDNNSLGAWTRDGRGVMFGSNMTEATAVEPYLANLQSGKTSRLAKAQGMNRIEDVSSDSRYVLLSRLVSRGSNDLYLLDTQSGKEVLLTPHEGPGQFNGRLSPDARTVYLVSNKDRDRTAFARVRLGANNAPGAIELIAERADAELEQMMVDEQGTLAALVWNVGGKSELALAELATGKLRPVSGLPADTVLQKLVFSRDGKQLAFAAMTATTPSDIWVLEVASGRARQITFSPHAGVNLAQLVKPTLVKFKAHDGVELSGWLYRPAGQKGTGAFVIDYHGGPEGQEKPVFRSDYQALLSRGIGVLAPNVRGSSGFGKRFVNLDNGAQRVNGVKDIKACVDFLIAQGLADPKRIGITGISYGGYMTMSGVTEFPDLFAAGAIICGFVNFETFFKHTEPWMAAISTVEYGDPATQAKMLRDLSPIHKVDRIKAAIMVQHGANDTNTPVVEAEQIVDNLKKRGVPVEYLLFPDEGHGFRKTPNRIKSTVAMVEFFVKYLKPAAQPAAAAP